MTDNCQSEKMESMMLAQSEIGGTIVTEKIRKTREGKPKSRNGCKTCKLRRVKCDETKPHCMRCTRFGQRCDGYLARAPSKQSLQVTTIRTLAPRGPGFSPSSEARSENSSASPSGQQSSPPPANRSSFPSQDEYESIQNFCAKSQRYLTRITTDKWHQFVFQACESSLPVRYAVLTLGALKDPVIPYPRGVGTLQHQSAYEQFKQSECQIEREFGGEPHDLKTTLTGCLLFFCIEGFQQSGELPVDRILIGLRQLREWASNVYGVGDRDRSLASLEAVDIDSEISTTFKNMEHDLMKHADERQRVAQQEYLQMGRPGTNPMPALFEAVDQAKASLELVIRRSMQWLRSSLRTQDFPVAIPKFDAKLLAVDPRFEDKALVLSEYKRWDEAFQPLLNFARSKGSSEENFLRASLLRLHWLSGYLSISSNNSQSSLLNSKQFTIELEELISIATLLFSKASVAEEMGIAERGGPEHGFAFDTQVLVPIMTVGWTIRHRTLRRQAVELLSRSSRRDEAWDGVVLGKIMAWLVDMEEEGIAEEDQNAPFVPEKATVRGIKMTFDNEGRTAYISCLQPSKDLSRDDEKERRTEIPW